MNTIKALHSLRPSAQWVLRGDILEWLDTVQAQPTEAEITAEVTRLQAEYDAKAYARSRAPEYPSIGDQLDALFHAGVFPAEMAAAIQAVKDKYPKGSA
tara:strand:- start:1008 stop:1304 length:297 start_codon:yes stop_codon:yes gene_type:complete